MRYFCLTVLIISFGTIQGLDYLKQDIQSMIKNNYVDTSVELPAQGSMKRVQDNIKEDKRDRKFAQNKANLLKNVRNHNVGKKYDRDYNSPKLSESIDKKIGREHFLIDPVLNQLHRRRMTRLRSGDNDDSSSSSLGDTDWKQEWKEIWIQKKFEALNSSAQRGDVVNMAAARPWGIPCGDPNQHDAPFGTCMLPAECEPEYRIYRGDADCGRTMYICCGIIATKYDMYNALDMSFEGSDFATDSSELKNNGKPDKKNKKTSKEKERNKRKKERNKRKTKMLNTIKKIIKEIRKILNSAFNNRTNEIKTKTKQLKKFIESMKKQYKKERQSVIKIHDNDLIKLDERVQAKLDQVLGVNENFMSNATFRDIVVNGTVSKRNLELLMRSYPELVKILKEKHRGGPKHKRRSGIDLILGLDEEDRPSRPVKIKPKKLNYDIEYGMLYY
ncbi:hypothetical protein HF086_013549 [Spodoptera exigua]|uniref:Uncharacterized protein n=1 Tax=Spodoptera exigua TaxID=7107 RepID=A0A922MU44_SPOEX|nr:hypothetical protein HF086_013549 [Spodoptera exigua]